MSKFSNLLRLLIIFKSEGRVKSKDIASALCISERMVRKYINDLLEAGINVQSIPGPTGGYEIIGYDYLLNVNLTDEELIAFKIICEESNIENDKLKSYLESLEEKLQVQRNLTKEYKDFSNNVFLNSKVNNLKLQNNIEIILYKAIIQNKKVDMSYTSLGHGNSNRVIHPYKIVTRSNFKYVIAYCEKSNEVRTFKLVRIDKIEILEEKFKIPEDVDLDNLTKDNKLGIMTGEDLDVKLLIKSPFSYSVRERIYSQNQKIKVNADESIIFEATLNGKEDTIRWILSMKSCVTIIEPISLKEEIKEELKKMIYVI